jgi:hypothetical protein
MALFIIKCALLLILVNKGQVSFKSCHNLKMWRHPGPWQCVLFLIPRSFHDGGALNYSTAPHRSKTTLISNGVFCLLESKILSIGQTLLHSLGDTNPPNQKLRGTNTEETRNIQR